MNLFFGEEDFNNEYCKIVFEKLRGSNPEPKEEFKNIAIKIFKDFSPKSVLDCSCVDPVLVLELRSLGVDAFGSIPYRNLVQYFSEEELKYCSYGSIVNNDYENIAEYGKYDLIVCIKDEDFISSLNFEKYINTLSRFSSKILFGVVKNNGKEEQKLNTPLISSVFFINNMYRKLDYCLYFFDMPIYLFINITKENIYKVIEQYEKILKSNEIEIENLNHEELRLRKRIAIYCKNMVVFKKLSKEYCKQKENFNVLEQHTMNLRTKIEHYVRLYNEIKESFFWRITGPFRFVLTFVKKFFRTFKKFALFFLKAARSGGVFKNLKLLFKYGLVQFYKTFIQKGKKAKPEVPRGVEYALAWKFYYKKIAPTKEDIAEQKKYNFKRTIVFSIIVPLYKTPEKYLIEMIESVLAQSYPYWQLCLADGTEEDESFSYISKCCEKYVEKDSRIIYKKIGKNLGIAENTNFALRLAEGEYICLLDHDDVLSPVALFENARVINKTKADVIYSDELSFEKKPENVVFMNLKPDFSPDTLTSNNYICHFLVFSRELQEQVGYFNGEYDGSQDYDFVFRLTEKAKKIEHIPKLLYYWRSTAKSTAKNAMVKPYFIDTSKKAIKAHLERLNREGEVVSGPHFLYFRVKYKISKNFKVSILIPNKDHIADLENCIKSIIEKSTYKNFEILILENGSSFETMDFYSYLKSLDSRIKVVKYSGKFNYSAINNNGVNFSSGQYIIFLNNDTEVITPNWIEEMLMYAQRDDVGAVGAKLYFKDDTIQHAGVFLGIAGIGGHGHKYFPRGDLGYAGRAAIVQNVSVVTGACMMVSKKAFSRVGGFDESLRVSFNDVDFCLKLFHFGYLNVFTPYAELYHYESKSRGYPTDNPAKYAEMLIEARIVRNRWHAIYTNGDPYYNINLTRKTEDFMVRITPEELESKKFLETYSKDYD